MQGLKVYKRSQGRYTRWITFAGVLLFALWGGVALQKTLGVFGASIYLQYGLPLVILVATAVITFRIVNGQRGADFLIATEGEMKKVSWSSRKEVVGSTKVVIVTTFILAALLFLVDFVFSNLFHMIGITG